MKIVLTAIKPRAHKILFCKDTPFRPQRVESQVKFQRNAKHREQQYG